MVLSNAVVKEIAGSCSHNSSLVSNTREEEEEVEEVEVVEVVVVVVGVVEDTKEFPVLSLVSPVLGPFSLLLVVSLASFVRNVFGVHLVGVR